MRPWIGPASLRAHVQFAVIEPGHRQLYEAGSTSAGGVPVGCRGSGHRFEASLWLLWWHRSTDVHWYVLLIFARAEALYIHVISRDCLLFRRRNESSAYYCSAGLRLEKWFVENHWNCRGNLTITCITQPFRLWSQSWDAGPCWVPGHSYVMVFEGAWTAWTTRDIRKSLLQLPLHKTRATFTGSSRNDLEIDQTAKEPRHGNTRKKIRLVCWEMLRNVEKVVALILATS